MRQPAPLYYIISVTESVSRESSLASPTDCLSVTEPQPRATATQTLDRLSLRSEGTGTGTGGRSTPKR